MARFETLKPEVQEHLDKLPSWKHFKTSRKNDLKKHLRAAANQEMKKHDAYVEAMKTTATIEATLGTVDTVCDAAKLNNAFLRTEGKVMLGGNTVNAIGERKLDQIVGLTSGFTSVNWTSSTFTLSPDGWADKWFSDLMQKASKSTKLSRTDVYNRLERLVGEEDHEEIEKVVGILFLAVL